MTSPNEIRRRREDIVTRGTEAFDESEFGQSAGGAATAEHCDEVDGLSDERARDGNDRFLHELLETPQGANGRASMNGADPAGMAGSPGFQQVQRFGATHLADWYAIRPQPERRTHEIGEGSNAIPGAQRHEVRRLALKLAGVLDQHHAIGRLRTSARSALTRVVFPVEVPPATRTLRRCPTALRRSSACAADMIPAGFLTSAARRGASVFKMRDVSRHKSMDVLQAYVRDADLFRDHAGAGLL